MKLEDQIVSLELAKRLKEFGVKQESLFYWFINQLVYMCDLSKWEKSKKYIFSAFTVAELGEMLPVGSFRSETYSSKGKITWILAELITDTQKAIFGKTEADARAKM